MLAPPKQTQDSGTSLSRELFQMFKNAQNRISENEKYFFMPQQIRRDSTADFETYLKLLLGTARVGKTTLESQQAFAGDFKDQSLETRTKYKELGLKSYFASMLFVCLPWKKAILCSDNYVESAELGQSEIAPRHAKTIMDLCKLLVLKKILGSSLTRASIAMWLQILRRLSRAQIGCRRRARERSLRSGVCNVCPSINGNKWNSRKIGNENQQNVYW